MERTLISVNYWRFFQEKQKKTYAITIKFSIRSGRLNNNNSYYVWLNNNLDAQMES